MKYFTLIIFSWLGGCTALSQNFEVEQIEQLFRPRVRVDARYVFDSPFLDTAGAYNSKEAAMVLTFPIKTNLGADVRLDLSSRKLKDILMNSVRLRASQTLGLIRLNGRQAYLGFDSLPAKNMAGATVGLLGLRLTRKYRVMFWSAGVNISEQDRTFSQAAPRASALLGQLHLRGLHKNFFYGVAVAYSDGLLLPLPFLGGSEPIGEKFIFNYTLPAQINLQYRPHSRMMVTGGLNIDGYRSGIEYHLKRSNINYACAAGYLNLRYKFSKALLARVEAGYLLYQHVRYSQADVAQKNFPLRSGPYVQAGFSILFGKTVWEKIFENISFGG
jgi:hypothetical protein